VLLLFICIPFLRNCFTFC